MSVFFDPSKRKISQTSLVFVRNRRKFKRKRGDFLRREDFFSSNFWNQLRDKGTRFRGRLFSVVQDNAQIVSLFHRSRTENRRAQNKSPFPIPHSIPRIVVTIWRFSPGGSVRPQNRGTKDIRLQRNSSCSKSIRRKSRQIIRFTSIHGPSVIENPAPPTLWSTRPDYNCPAK